MVKRSRKRRGGAGLSIPGKAGAMLQHYWRSRSPDTKNAVLVLGAEKKEKS
jgi:hypothetical protein